MSRRSRADAITGCVLAVLVWHGSAAFAQSDPQRALELYNAAFRESEASRQIDLLRRSVQTYETAEGTIALGDALLRGKRDALEARRLCDRAFATLINPEATQGRSMQALALVCVARSYRATGDAASAVVFLKRALEFQRAPVVEQELRELVDTGFKSAKSIAAELAASDGDAATRSGGGVAKGAYPREASADVYVNFEFNQSTLTADGVRQVEELSKAFALVSERALTRARYRIIGHTDVRGSDEYNLTLSRRRAETVRGLLVSKYGVAASELIAEGRGKQKPLVDGTTDEDHARNRRVEVQRIQ